MTTPHTVRETHLRVYIDLNPPQSYTDVLGRNREVHGVRIEYLSGRVEATAEHANSSSLLPQQTVDNLPWLSELIDRYQPASPETLCTCGHAEDRHIAFLRGPGCLSCPTGSERPWQHPFTPEES